MVSVHYLFKRLVYWIHILYTGGVRYGWSLSTSYYISVERAMIYYLSDKKENRKQLFTWLSLVVSLMASFVLSFFPLDVLDEIWDLIESVSEGFLTYSYIPVYGGHEVKIH